MKRTGTHSEYERTFEIFVRQKKVPIIPTNEVKKSFDLQGKPLKNFDLILFSKGSFLLDLKGKNFGFDSVPGNKWECWTHDGDAKALIKWEKIFRKNGCELTPLLVFMYRIKFPGDEREFKDVIKLGNKKFGVVAITPQKYLLHAKIRSMNPRTLSISRKVFKELAKPISDFIPKLRSMR